MKINVWSEFFHFKLLNGKFAYCCFLTLLRLGKAVRNSCMVGNYVLLFSHIYTHTYINILHTLFIYLNRLNTHQGGFRKFVWLSQGSKLTEIQQIALLICIYKRTTNLCMVIPWNDSWISIIISSLSFVIRFQIKCVLHILIENFTLSI